MISGDLRKRGRFASPPTLNSTSITKLEAVNPRRDHSHPCGTWMNWCNYKKQWAVWHQNPTILWSVNIKIDCKVLRIAHRFCKSWSIYGAYIECVRSCNVWNKRKLLSVQAQKTEKGQESGCCTLSSSSEEYNGPCSPPPMTTRDLVPAADYQRILNFPYMKDEAELFDFTTFVGSLGVKKINGNAFW